MKTKYLLFILLVVIINIKILSQTSNKLEIKFMISSGAQRTVWNDILSKFKKENPDIIVSSSEYSQEEYKNSIEQWLKSNTSSGDILFWFAGAKLKYFVEKNYVYSIDEMWKKNNFDKEFTVSSKNSVSFKNKVYGIPLSYYQWGFYYNKQIFTQYKLTEPTNWTQFLNVCKTLKSNNITPIVIGAKYGWPAAGWFDYLNLRINGLDFHLNLMAGIIPYTDPKVKKVFIEWKNLIDNKYFNEDFDTLDWDQILPYLYRNAAMLLMGNFVVNKISDKIIPNIGFFRFPLYDPKVGYYEEAPMDILIIPNNALNKENAEKFLQFVSRADIQYLLNSNMGMISPNVNTNLGDDIFIKAGAKILKEAKGISQFYDRDTLPEIYKETMPMMLEFMKNPDNIDKILEKMENVRKKALNIH